MFTLASQEVDFRTITFAVFGGIALFLLGIRMMSDGLKQIAGEGMKTLLAKLTRNRFTAAIVGAFVTAVIQSSTVTTVLVVGFVTAGLMTVPQTVGVIMGANIGSTFTAQVIAFNITQYALLMIGLGFVGGAIAKRDAFRQFGGMLMGLGMVFLAMDIMSRATSPLRTYDPFIELMANMDNAVLAVIVGAIATIVLQSSAATTGIVIMLASQGLISLEAGIAISLGANIGTCATAILAAVGKRREAMQAAMVHLLFNVLGTLLWIGLVSQLADLARWASPTAPQLEGLARAAAEAPRQIANAHTIFNVANTLILIWFAGPIGRLAQWLVPSKPAPPVDEVKPRYLDTTFIDTPAIALDHVRKEIAHMGEMVDRMLVSTPHAVQRGTRQELMRVRAANRDLQTLYTAIVDYMRMLGRKQLSSPESRKFEDTLTMANHVSSIGDLIGYNLVGRGLSRIDANLTFSESTVTTLQKLYDAIIASIRDVMHALTEQDGDLARKVVAQRETIDKLSENVRLHLQQRLLAEDPNRVQTFQLEVDIVGQVARLYYFARKTGEIIARQFPPKASASPEPAPPSSPATQAASESDQPTNAAKRSDAEADAGDHAEKP